MTEQNKPASEEPRPSEPKLFDFSPYIFQFDERSLVRIDELRNRGWEFAEVQVGDKTVLFPVTVPEPHWAAPVRSEEPLSRIQQAVKRVRNEIALNRGPITTTEKEQLDSATEDFISDLEIICEAALASRASSGPNVEIIAARVHDGWMETKRAMGFHGPDEPCIAEQYNFGPCTSLVRCRTFHADLIPYEQLTDAKKELDRVTVRTVLKAMSRAEAEVRAGAPPQSANDAARMKLNLKLMTAMHSVGITDMWEAQERIHIADLEQLLASSRQAASPPIEARCDLCKCQFDTFEDFHEHLYWHDSKGLIGKGPTEAASPEGGQAK